jgi:hypothetical protein
MNDLLAGANVAADALRSGVFNQIWLEGFAVGVLTCAAMTFFGWLVWVMALNHVKALLDSGTDLHKYYNTEQRSDESKDIQPVS